jgi:hypothetical protein
MFGASHTERAYLAPFLAFFALLAAGSAVEHFGEGHASWLLSETRYWVCPLQTLVCGGLLIRYWRVYQWKLPAKLLLTVTVAALALVIWIAPQQWLHSPRRLEGFDPAFFGASGWPYFLNLGFRLLRLVIVVPLLEEIFWRGFLLRYLIDDHFTAVPMGSFSWLSFGVVTAGFCLEHSPTDWPAAIVTGALYNFVAYRTRSLSSCVLAHAITNALLGAYVLHTAQWGFW